MRRFLLTIAVCAGVGVLVALGMFFVPRDSTGFLADNRAAVVGGVAGLLSVLVVQRFAARSQVLAVPCNAKSTSPASMTSLTTNRWVRIGARAILASCIANVVIGALLVAGFVFAQDEPRSVLYTGVFFIALGIFAFFWLRRKFVHWGLISSGPRPNTSTVDLL